LLMILIWYAVRGRYEIYPYSSAMGVGVENHGVSIDVVELDNTIFSFGYATHGPLAILVRTPTRVFWLRTLNDLRGSVGIYNETGALQYVRLITSEAAYFAGISHALEIYPSSSQGGDSSGGNHAVYSAVLNDKDYQAAGFTKTEVTQSGGVYHIRRWVCVFDTGKASAVEYWDETVHTNGAYSRQVLIRKPPPMVHGEEWWGPMRK